MTTYEYCNLLQNLINLLQKRNNKRKEESIHNPEQKWIILEIENYRSRYKLIAREYILQTSANDRFSASRFLASIPDNLTVSSVRGSWIPSLY